MPYRHLKWDTIQDPTRRTVFQHTDMYLFDTYGMLQRSLHRTKTGAAAISARLWCFFA